MDQGDKKNTHTHKTNGRKRVGVNRERERDTRDTSLPGACMHACVRLRFPFLCVADWCTGVQVVPLALR